MSATIPPPLHTSQAYLEQQARRHIPAASPSNLHPRRRFEQLLMAVGNNTLLPAEFITLFPGMAIVGDLVQLVADGQLHPAELYGCYTGVF